MVYGSDLQVYGATPCPRCGLPHPAASQIRETRASRFRLMQLVAEMGTVVAQGNAPRIHAGAGQKFMLGLLIAGGQTFVSTSGGNLNNASFVAAANRKQYVICPPRKYSLGVNLSVVGRAIPGGQYMSMQAPGASPAGDCAAPRMIQQAIQALPGPPFNPSAWEMSEVYYQPNTARRTDDNSYWVHGLSAHSCATCANLVPLLLCPLP